MVGAIALAILLAPTAQAQQSVLQRGYDANVSGADLTETTLNTSSVGPNTFGLLFKLPVDESVFAQPLYVADVAIPNHGTVNVLYVATMNDTLYAFDADAGGAPLWSVNLASLFDTTAVVWANFTQGTYSPTGNLGILSTPVIDPSTNVMYVVACTLEKSTMAYRLHAIDITTGSEPYGPGVLITGSYGGSNFNAPDELQRMSLVLSDNQIVFGFSAIAEIPGIYLGWVMAYDKQTLQQSGVFAPVTTGNLQGGVWQSGRPPAVDGAGYVYLFSGNTTGGGYNGVNDFSESALKLDPSHGLNLVDWFTPSVWSHLDANDLDLSSSGPLLIPGTSLIAGGGKTGELYVLNTANLGKFTANDNYVVQEENITAGLMILGGPVYWSRSAANGGPMLYNWGAGDVVKAYPFNGSTFASNPSAEGTSIANMPGGTLTVSADADAQGSGVLWATTPGIPSAGGNPSVPAALHAFDAGDNLNELWNSRMNETRDGYGLLTKYVPPLVANGKVYMATSSKQVAVYGLLPDIVSPISLAFGSETTTVASTAQSVTVTNTGAAALPIMSITLAGANPGQFSQSNTCGTSVAPDSTCTVSVVFKPTAAGSKTAILDVNAAGGAGTQPVTQPVTLTGTGVAPAYTVSPTSLAFGSQQTDTSSAAQSVTVTNTGAAALPITRITITGTNSTQFSQTNTCGTSVAAGSTCTINVMFDPTYTGSKTATLDVNAGGTVTQPVTLSGIGTEPYTVSPTSLAFGSEQTNTSSAAQSVTVTNTGAAALPITRITITGTNSTQFSQTNTCGTSVAAGSTCTINVTFDPTYTGSKTATLDVNAGGGGVTQPVTLSGIGTEPYTVSPTSLAFGSEQTSTSSTAQSVTVTNTGAAALPITRITITGTNSTQFTQTNTCGTSVAAGSTCTINVMFDPTYTGSKTATLDVNAGGGGVTQPVTLSGIGVAPT
jgi:hypothetical protein